MRPITVLTKPGTVTHVVMPGASSMRGVTGYRLFGRDERRARAAHPASASPPPARAAARSRSSPGSVDAGEQWVYSELVVGTWGGRPVADGNDGLANPCASMANIPVEVAETDWPILIERYGLVDRLRRRRTLPRRARDRAGLARARARTPPCTCARTARCTAPYGLDGGREGAAVVERCSSGRTETLERMPPMFVDRCSPATSSTTGCRAAAATATRSSATPSRRARRARREGLGRGGARELYGVVVGATAMCDQVATTAELRGEVGAR